MWYTLAQDRDVIVLNTVRGAHKDRNLRRDARMSLCVEDDLRYLTLEGHAGLITDRAQQQREVNALIAPPISASGWAGSAERSFRALTESASTCT